MNVDENGDSDQDDNPVNNQKDFKFRIRFWAVFYSKKMNKICSIENGLNIIMVNPGFGFQSVF